MFEQDFKRTYSRIESRTKEIIAEEEEQGGEVEQIQLVAEDPSVEISFRIPDGPPPAELRVEGEGAEDIDIEDVSSQSNSGHVQWLKGRDSYEHGFSDNGRHSMLSLRS